MRHTHGHTRNRRSHHALEATNIVKDKETGNFRLPHRLDEATGMYRGKLIVPERKKALKAEDKRREKNHREKGEVTKAEGVKEPIHDKHPVAETKEKKGGLMGRMTKGKAKSRSGFGGGV